MNKSHEAPTDRLSPIILGEAPSHGERTRTLIEAGRQATLCTLMPRGPVSSVDGYPYGSIVNYALDGDGHPLLLTSALAEHTHNFKADPRASLFVHEDSNGAHDPLALGRATLLGKVEDVAGNERDAVTKTYLERHPDARYYVEYRDFAFYRLRVEAIRYIGGFGRMSWVDVDEYHRATPDPIAPHVSGIVAHMNADHADALVQLSRHPAALDDVQRAEMQSVDCYGFEMSATTVQGPRFVRLGFGRRVTTPDDVRAAIIEMLRASREATQK